ncbi:hypothetical protein [Aporhodopirellula aestuarii]|uniref:Uncharacterized protein n=1 Tax=Aporhodopirellula aestuarii TaxID=2950107 RepID=A0ABT0TX73_9BACT|nr:hypothetical protein [Aporhodopirellula aestuarii]MCM2369213.1 hypothetical protein [Aporhodopirellula aestuarii]
MSMRDHFYSLTSIEAIRACVASGNESAVEAIVRGYLEDSDLELDDEPEYRHNAETMIMCEKPPRKEPGCWFHVVPYLAVHLGLSPDDNLPINEGWKHSHVWHPYRKLLRRHITRASRQYLAHLDDGRPLLGKAIQYNGCVFSWLIGTEVQDLYESLSKLDPSVITIPDLTGFHEDFVESLRIVASQSRDLFAGA